MKRVFQFFAMFNFLMIVGTVGGIEHNNIGLLAGMVLCVLFFGLMMLFAHLGGMFYNGRR